MRLEIMKVLILCVAVLVGISACKDKKVRVEYTNGTPPIDSNSVLSIRFDKEGNVTEYYMDEKLFNRKNLIAANSILNGSLFYEVKKDSLGRTHKVKTFKYSYIKDIYSVYIEDDTVAMGEDFIGIIKLSEKDIALKLEDSISYKSKYEESGTLRTLTFYKKTNKTGIEKFKGQLKHKDKTIPFEYNYVIIESQNDF